MQCTRHTLGVLAGITLGSPRQPITVTQPIFQISQKINEYTTYDLAKGELAASTKTANAVFTRHTLGV